MLVFYVSGHGYGHAARAGAVMEALWRIAPELRVAVRSEAPRMMFPERAEYHSVRIDSAVVESADALSVDNERSVAEIRRLLADADGIVRREAAFLRDAGAEAIAGDIPFLGGAIARASGLRAVAMGNFLWDWIFEGAAPAPVLTAVREAYSGYSHALRFPLSHAEGWEVFPSVSDVALVTPRSARPREEIREELGLTRDTRPAVLIGGRARLTAAVLERMRRECSDFVFLTPDMHDSFSDLLRASDLVVAKIGYSLAAECIAEGKRLLFPPRTGFREESILVPQARRYLTALPIPLEDWSQGRWRSYLHALLKAPAPSESIAATGAAECAAALFTVIRP